MNTLHWFNRDFGLNRSVYPVHYLIGKIELNSISPPLQILNSLFTTPNAAKLASTYVNIFYRSSKF